MKTHWRYAVLPTLLLTLLLLSVSKVHAQEPQPPDDAVNAIAEQLYCPVCENVPLDACETDACVQWRDLIRDKLAEGWTPEQIKDHFVELYGIRVLAVPPAQGFNRIVYLVPAVFFLLVLMLGFFRMKNWRQVEVDEQEDVSTAVDDALFTRLNADLDHYRDSKSGQQDD